MTGERRSPGGQGQGKSDTATTGPTSSLSISPSGIDGYLRVAVEAALAGRQARREGRETRFLCPAHDDHHPSARWNGDKGAWFCDACGAGGGVLDLAKLLGIPLLEREPSGLRVTDLAAAKGLDASFLRSLGVADGVAGLRRAPCVDVPYMDTSGQVVAVRKRLSLQGERRFAWRRGDKPVPYGLWRLEEAHKPGILLLLEGESDSWTCWQASIPGLGVPGAATWRVEWGEHVDGIAEVYLWREPDGGGDTLAAKVAASIPHVRIIAPPPDAKDPSALWLLLGRDGDAFRQRMQELMAAARPAGELRAEAVSREAGEVLERSGGLLDRPDLLAVVGRAIHDLGYAGDVRKPVLLYVAVTSRLLRQPVNIAAYGPSAAGKNFLADTVARLFPSAAIYDATASSERAWVYTQENFRHRIIIIGESAALHRDGVGASIIRSVAWGGRIAYDTVEKTADGLRGRRIEKQGPTGIITTATKPLEGELATRFLTIEIPDDPNQTKAILAASAAQVNGAQPPPDPDLGPLVAVQEWLQLAGATAVSVPFANRLAELFPTEMVRARRDFTHLLTLIQAHALLYQRQRRRDEGGQVVAELADYSGIYYLAADVFAALSAGGVTNAIRKTVEWVAALYKDGQPVTIPALAASLGLHRSTVYRRAVSACALGFLVNTETREGRPLKLVPGEPLPEERSALPHPDDLGAVDVCVHPPANACNRATEGFGQIGAKYEPAVAQAVARPTPVAATATSPATVVATDGADMGLDSEASAGCAVAAENEGYSTHTHPHEPVSAPAAPTPAPADDGRRKLALDLWEATGRRPIRWKPGETIFDLRRWLPKATDEEVTRVVELLEAMPALKGGSE